MANDPDARSLDSRSPSPFSRWRAQDRRHRTGAPEPNDDSACLVVRRLVRRDCQVRASRSALLLQEVGRSVPAPRSCGRPRSRRPAVTCFLTFSGADTITPAAPAGILPVSKAFMLTGPLPIWSGRFACRSGLTNMASAFIARSLFVLPFGMTMQSGLKTPWSNVKCTGAPSATQRAGAAVPDRRPCRPRRPSSAASPGRRNPTTR